MKKAKLTIDMTIILVLGILAAIFILYMIATNTTIIRKLLFMLG